MKTNVPVFTLLALLLGGGIIAAYVLTRPVPVEEQPKVVKQISPPVSQPIKGEIKRAEVKPEPKIEYFEPAPAAGIQNQYPQPPSSIDDSDAYVLEAVKYISPEIVQYLVPADQVRKWVLAVDKLAEGKMPRRYRPVEYPLPKFEVQSYGEFSVGSDQNYQRLVNLMTLVAEIDIAVLGDFYRAWQPLLEEAYAQQGEAGTFEERLELAIGNILAVHPLAEQPLLVRPHVLYQFADEELEQATDVEKFCWRIGQDNLETLQTFAKSFLAEIRSG